jgi:hypothetical protein
MRRKEDQRRPLGNTSTTVEGVTEAESQDEEGDAIRHGVRESEGPSRFYP